MERGLWCACGWQRCSDDAIDSEAALRDSQVSKCTLYSPFILSSLFSLRWVALRFNSDVIWQLGMVPVHGNFRRIQSQFRCCQAGIVKSLLKLFKRKKAPPLACYMTLDQDKNHVHTAACFLKIEPLALAELFQAQGCESFPPVIPGIHESTNDFNVHLVTYDVTYFDHLVKDSFASPSEELR